MTATRAGGRQRGASFSDLALVALGGAAGTLARYGAGELVGGAAVATLLVNLVGAFALGALVTVLGRPGWSAARRRVDTAGRKADTLASSAGSDRLRLLLGTGVLGGFTTYSGLATETAELLQAGSAWQALGYASFTLIAGLGASLAGIWMGGIGATGTPTADHVGPVSPAGPAAAPRADR